MKHNQSLRTTQSHSLHPSTRIGLVVIALMIALFSSATISAKNYELFSDSKKSNTVILTKRAMITSVNASGSTKSYAIWRNGSALLAISNLHYYRNDMQSHHIKGILEPGRYVLRVNPGATVRIKLSTTIKPQKILLWGKHHKIVKPLEQGNKLVITSPTKITAATYTGTEGFTIQAVRVNARPSVILRFISPHKRGGHGPRVIGGTGGKTVVGQTLPAGVYRVAVGQGTADGIVECKITLKVQ